MDFSIGQNIIKNAFSILKDSKKHRVTSILPSQMIAVGSNPKPLNGQGGARPNPILEIEDYNNLTTQLTSYSDRLGSLPETFSSSIPVTSSSGTENILKPRNPIPKSERRKQKPTTTAVVCCGGKCKCSRCMNVPLEIAGVGVDTKHDTKFNEIITEDGRNNNDTLDKNRIEMSKFKPNRLSKRNKQPNLYETHDPTIRHHSVEKFEIPIRPQTTHPAKNQSPVISFIPLNARSLNNSNPDKMNNFSNQELLLRPKTACRLFVNKDSESSEEHKFYSYKQSSANKEPYISSLLHPGYENRCPSKTEKLFWSSNGGCHNTESNAKFNKQFGSQFRLDGSMVKDFKISRPQHIEIPKYIRQACRGQERNYQEQTMAAKRLRKKVIRTGVDP